MPPKKAPVEWVYVGTTPDRSGAGACLSIDTPFTRTEGSEHELRLEAEGLIIPRPEIDTEEAA